LLKEFHDKNVATAIEVYLATGRCMNRLTCRLKNGGRIILTDPDVCLTFYAGFIYASQSTAYTYATTDDEKWLIVTSRSLEGDQLDDTYLVGPSLVLGKIEGSITLDLFDSSKLTDFQKTLIRDCFDRGDPYPSWIKAYDP